jgi:hypothetical protein
MRPRRFASVSFTALVWLALAAVAGHAAALPGWTDRAKKEWWAKNSAPENWPSAATALQAQLEAAYRQDGAHVFSDSDFRAWLDHLEWIRLGLADSADLADPAQRKTFMALGQDEGVSHLFVEKLDPRWDKPVGALHVLLSLAEAGPDLDEYAALGVAFAVVWDQPFPEGWPHRQVAPAAVPIGDLDVVQRFNFYVQSNRDHKLVLDPTQLSVENLKFLVDSEVKLSELRYAQGNRTSLSHFADAYFSINYDRARITTTPQVYVWPGDTYTLADIEKAGGICIDQAYYAATVGKGLGIPTIRFTGYGMDGAHAWFGYLGSSGKWELDCGRYEEQDFPKGFAVDPQTWQKIDDSTLENVFKNGAANVNFAPAMAALAWAHLHESDPVAYGKILDDARGIMPEWSATWRLQAELIDAGHDLDRKKTFYQDWVTQFSNFPEMKVEGQTRLYLALEQANDPDADGLLKDIILQNRSEGFDLGIDAGAAAIDAKLKAQDWDGVRETYDRAVRDFGEQGGLTLFARIIYPLTKACLASNHVELADHVLSFAQDRVTMDPSSQVGQEFMKLKGEVEAAKKEH